MVPVLCNCSFFPKSFPKTFLASQNVSGLLECSWFPTLLLFSRMIKFFPEHFWYAKTFRVQQHVPVLRDCSHSCQIIKIFSDHFWSPRIVLVSKNFSVSQNVPVFTNVPGFPNLPILPKGSQFPRTFWFQKRFNSQNIPVYKNAPGLPEPSCSLNSFPRIIFSKNIYGSPTCSWFP